MTPLETSPTFEPCGSCGKPIDPDEAEICWYCQGPLCGECWEEKGHCGHVGADMINRCANRRIPMWTIPLTLNAAKRAGEYVEKYLVRLSQLQGMPLDEVKEQALDYAARTGYSLVQALWAMHHEHCLGLLDEQSREALKEEESEPMGYARKVLSLGPLAFFPGYPLLDEESRDIMEEAEREGTAHE